MDIGMSYGAMLNMAFCLVDKNWMGALGWFVASALFFSKFIEKTRK